MITVVVISKQAIKDLRRVPSRIVKALDLWTRNVRELGLETVRRIPGYHDEPLKGDRKGQRSIRLNLQYRAIYEVKTYGTIEFASVEEVGAHDY